MLKEIFKNSITNLRKNLLYSLTLSLIAIMMIALTFSCDLIGINSNFGGSLNLGTWFIFPFILMPILFAVQVTHFGLRQNVNPNGTLFFRFFKLYFVNFYRGVFRFILSALFAMLISYGVTLIFGAISIPIVESIDPNFAKTINDLYSLINNNELEAALKLIQEDKNFVLVAYISYLPGYGLGAMMFFLSSTFNSISTYFKIKNPNLNPAFVNRIYAEGRNSIRKQLIKEYWGLNWPIFVLFVVGYSLGSVLSFYLEYNYLFANIISLIIGFGFMIFYFPIFINNLESIFLHHEKDFANAPILFQKKMEEVLSAQLDSLNSQMNALNKQMQDSKKDNQNDDENNSNNESNLTKEDKIIDADVKDKEEK